MGTPPSSSSSNLSSLKVEMRPITSDTFIVKLGNKEYELRLYQSDSSGKTWSEMSGRNWQEAVKEIEQIFQTLQASGKFDPNVVKEANIILQGEADTSLTASIPLKNLKAHQITVLKEGSSTPEEISIVDATTKAALETLCTKILSAPSRPIASARATPVGSTPLS